MTFEKDYEKLVATARQKARMHKVEIDPSEILSELYLQHFATPEFKYSFIFFEKAIYQYCANFKNSNSLFNTEKLKRKSHSNFTYDTTCSVCKEIKTSSCFPIITFPNGYKFQQIRCDECIAKANIINFKNYVEKNREDWNKYLRVRHKKEKENLTDAYIRKLLKHKYTNEFLLKNPHLIRQKRKQLTEKRNKKK